MISSRLVALGAACAFMVMGDAAMAQGDAAAGATAFVRCRACHLFDATGRHRVGPNLAGVFGRTAGTVEDFPRYTDLMKTLGIVWDETTLNTWLSGPGRNGRRNHDENDYYRRHHAGQHHRLFEGRRSVKSRVRRPDPSEMLIGFRRGENP